MMHRGLAFTAVFCFRFLLRIEDVLLGPTQGVRPIVDNQSLHTERQFLHFVSGSHTGDLVGFLQRLELADAVNARNESQPVGSQDEQQDGHEDREEFLHHLLAGDILVEVVEDLDKPFHQVLQPAGHILQLARSKQGQHNKDDIDDQRRNKRVGQRDRPEMENRFGGKDDRGKGNLEQDGTADHSDQHNYHDNCVAGRKELAHVFVSSLAQT